MLADVSADVWVSVISRWVHILSAIIAVGGTIFMRQVLMPAANATLPDDVHERLREGIRAKWGTLLHTCIALLLVTGFYNFYVNGIKAKPGGLYHGIFGVKFLLALAVFFLATALAGRSEAFASLRADRRKWMGVVIGMAVGIVLLSSLLRYAPLLSARGG